MWLNDGDGEFGRVLKPETVRMAERNGLDGQRVKLLPGVIPVLSNDAEFFLNEPKSWSLAFMVNDGPLPTGRPAGALSWRGLRIATSGSTARTASAAIGRRRSYRS